MYDRFNTIAGWTLFSGIVALGFSSLSSHYFMADSHEAPETMGYAVVGATDGGAAATAVAPIANRLAKADAAKGEAIFAKCKSCHTIDQGAANGIGPNLWAVIGDAIGAGRNGFAFSDSLKAKGGKWDFALLDTWLTNPKAFADGTKMSFAGLASPEDRANVIMYLNSKGSNLPLPAPVADAAPAAGTPAGGAVTPAVAMVGDPAAGEKVFAKCKSCHSIDQGGANGIGPNLYAVAGDAIGQGRNGFAFSDALKAHKGNWDEATLNTWLTSPAKFATGTKMTFAGLDDAKQRADVIAYLNSKGGKLTLAASGPAAAPAAK